MKKLFALILALAMVLSVSAMAEDEIATVSWEDAAATAETILPGISELGEFFSIEGTGLKIWIPIGLQQRETIGDLMLYLFADEDVSHAVTVIAEEAPEGYDVTTAEGLAAYVRDVVTPSDAEAAVVNGIFCIGYSLGEDDMKQAVVSYGTASGLVLSFVIEPYADVDEDVDNLAISLIASSIMADE